MLKTFKCELFCLLYKRCFVNSRYKLTLFLRVHIIWTCIHIVYIVCVENVRVKRDTTWTSPWSSAFMSWSCTTLKPPPCCTFRALWSWTYRWTEPPFMPNEHGLSSFLYVRCCLDSMMCDVFVSLFRTNSTIWHFWWIKSKEALVVWSTSSVPTLSWVLKRP